MANGEWEERANEERERENEENNEFCMDFIEFVWYFSIELDLFVFRIRLVPGTQKPKF